ncbi:hypothetical protein MFRU_062g00120 [Monilinia fructicola]|nr:hypothetical protein MFRU_062g00120 [Monilinia fructicola]
MAQNRSQSGPFHCGYNGCTQTFTRRTGARRHEMTVHGDKKYCCHEPDCNYRGGKRRNDFIRHMKEKHPEHDDHLFIPEDFNNPQESQSPFANCCQSPEIMHDYQFSGDFSQMSPLPSTSFEPSFNPIDTNEKPPTPTMIPLGLAGVPQPYGNMISPNIIPLRPPDVRAFQVCNLPHPEFEPVPAAATARGDMWGEFNPSNICSTGSNLQETPGASLENEYEPFGGPYNVGQHGQMGDNSYYKW